VIDRDDREREESGEIPNPAKRARKLVEEREAGGGEEGAALSEEPGDDS
jgi:hypothetical protein